MKNLKRKYIISFIKFFFNNKFEIIIHDIYLNICGKKLYFWSIFDYIIKNIQLFIRFYLDKIKAFDLLKFLKNEKIIIDI